MMNKMKIAGLVGSALLLCGTQAQAEIAWTFNSPTGDSSTLGNTVSKTVDGVMATAQAWANTNDGSGSSSKGSSSSTTAATYTLETAYLNVYSGGLGVKNQDFTSSTTSGDYNEGTYTYPAEHTTDNNQRYDSVLFSFSNAIDLNSITIGYRDNDSDITVLAYTATSCSSGTCSSDVSGKSYAQLASYGWSLIGQYADLIANSAKSVNPDNVVSSYWLIGAANTLVGGTKDTSKDYVKLLALAGDKYTPPCTPGTPGCGGGGSGVPEPGTLLLMGAGLLGLTRINARRVVRSAT